jgi:hypothetical protein
MGTDGFRIFFFGQEHDQHGRKALQNERLHDPPGLVPSSDSPDSPASNCSPCLVFLFLCSSSIPQGPSCLRADAQRERGGAGFHSI